MNAVAAPITPAFRPMALEDIDRVLLIERVAYPFPWTRGNFCDCLESGYSCWLAEVDGEIVGYSIFMVGAGEGHILNCCVDPHWQSRGLGRALMYRLIESASEFGAEVLFLEVRPSNSRAIELYISLGFETVGLRRHYYPAVLGREDAMVMRRVL